MRLYLSSFRVGNHPEKLVDMLHGGKRVAMIANATDARDAAARTEAVETELRTLEALGLDATEIDLRAYFDGSFTVGQLRDYDMVWVRGGNAFNLRRAMRYSGFDTVITELLQDDAIVYGGYSAGACVLAPDLHGIELCDPPDAVPEGYKADIIWEGLNLIPYAIAPHYQSEHPESAVINDVVEYFEEHNIAYEPLRDGEAIIINGETTEKLT